VWTPQLHLQLCPTKLGTWTKTPLGTKKLESTLISSKEFSAVHQIFSHESQKEVLNDVMVLLDLASWTLCATAEMILMA